MDHIKTSDGHALCGTLVDLDDTLTGASEADCTPCLVAGGHYELVCRRIAKGFVPVAQFTPLGDLAAWLVSLDDVEGPGAEARKTVTLNKIIERARIALGTATPVEPAQDAIGPTPPQPAWVRDARTTGVRTGPAYPYTENHFWATFPLIAIEMDGYNGVEVIDPYTGRVLYVPGVFEIEADTEPDLYEAIRRAVDAAQARKFLGGADPAV